MEGNSIKLSEREKRVLDILRRNEHWTKYAVERRSDEEFDNKRHKET